MIASLPESPAQRNKIEIERQKWEELSLHTFVCEFWSVIEPGKPFIDGKHIQALCLHLEAVTDGKILRLLVNMPPRHAKSTIISVFWPVWSWIKNPAMRFLCASYALNLAIRDNVKARRLVQSPKFQKHYRHLFQLAHDQNAKMKFETTLLGYRMAVSVGSAATGEGGDVLILDDPHSIDEKESDVKREAALAWFNDTWSTRLNDAQTGTMVVVGQRIHESDVSGRILEGNTDGEWVHLNLAAEFDPGTACRTYYPDGKELWEDWRTEEGELLWPERFPRKAIERAKRIHGILGYSALYQQSPVPPGGYVFEAQYERLFSIDTEANLYLLETPDGIKPVVMTQCAIYITSDVAAKAKEEHDYTVFCVWAITPRKEILLLYVFRDHLRIPKQIEKGYQIYLAYLDDRFQSFWFEDVAYQSAFGQFMLEKGVPCEPFHPKGDKVVRAGGAAIQLKLGNVYVLKHASWLEKWRDELYKFPKAAHDDQTDNISMMCIIVKHARDVEPLDEETASALRGFVGY